MPCVVMMEDLALSLSLSCSVAIGGCKLFALLLPPFRLLRRFFLVNAIILICKVFEVQECLEHQDPPPPPPNCCDSHLTQNESCWTQADSNVSARF
jgi:hypothetical protein